MVHAHVGSGGAEVLAGLVARVEAEQMVVQLCECALHSYVLVLRLPSTASQTSLCLRT